VRRENRSHRTLGLFNLVLLIWIGEEIGMTAFLVPLFIFTLFLPSLPCAQASLQLVVVTYSSRSIASILGLPAPVPASRVFGFSLQREVNQELGAKQ
jgi:hypothetical protein